MSTDNKEPKEYIQNLFDEVEAISQRAQENRAQRIEIARRLNDLRSQNEKKQHKRSQLENDMKLIEKRQLLQKLVNKRQSLDDIKRKIIDSVVVQSIQ